MSSGLNLAQLRAVHFTGGPCLVLAGAGSGKTRVITHKIAHLIGRGMDPKAIAAITFTNKAAAEMRERAKNLIGRDAKKVLICTFHALGVRMMREDGSVLGLKPQFSILDSDDVTSILKDCGGTTDAATARQWQWAISLWKNTGLNAAQVEAQAKDDSERITARIMARYEERLSAYQSVDFDDLIRLPVPGRPIVLKVKDTWPRTNKVYCHRADWPDDAEVIERVPTRSCTQRGAAIDLVLDRGREFRSQIVFTRARGREMIFWQTARTSKQARPNVRTPTARASGQDPFEIIVDVHERYPWKFTDAQVTTRRAPVGFRRPSADRRPGGSRLRPPS